MKFQFECSGCGNCCKHYTVLLTIYDCARLSKKTGLKLEEFITCYEEGDVIDASPGIYFHSQSKKFLLGLKKTNNACVFLKENKCSIHSFKPSVCQLFPLNIEWNGEEESKVEIIHYPNVNAHYDQGFTEFGDVIQTYTKYWQEYEGHRECIENWKKSSYPLKSPEHFFKWLQGEIDSQWGNEVVEKTVLSKKST